MAEDDAQLDLVFLVNFLSSSRRDLKGGRMGRSDKVLFGVCHY